MFGRHIGKRAADGLGRPGRLPLARETRGDAESSEAHLPVYAVHKDIGRLDVFVDEAALVDLAHSHRDADRETQKASHFHGRAEQTRERLAARIFEHQHGPTAFAPDFQRAHSPCTVELVLQRVFVGKAIKAGGRLVLSGRQHGQYGGSVAVRGSAPSSAQDTFAVLPQDLEAVFSPSAEPKR